MGWGPGFGRPVAGVHGRRGAGRCAVVLFAHSDLGSQWPRRSRQLKLRAHDRLPPASPMEAPWRRRLRACLASWAEPPAPWAPDRLRAPRRSCVGLSLPFSCCCLITPRSLPRTVGPWLRGRSSVPRVSRELTPRPPCRSPPRRLGISVLGECCPGCAWRAPAWEESDGVRAAEAPRRLWRAWRCPIVQAAGGFLSAPVSLRLLRPRGFPTLTQPAFWDRPRGLWRRVGSRVVPTSALGYSGGIGRASGRPSVLAGSPGRAPGPGGRFFSFLSACFYFTVGRIFKSMGRYPLTFFFFRLLF